MTFTTRTIFNSLKKDGVLRIGRALDIGCREGKDALNFAREGFIVDALDSDAEAIRNIPSSSQINLIISKIEDFKIVPNTYDLVSCQYVLHFLDKNTSKEIIKKIVEGTKPKGITAFNLLGEKDEWKDKWTTWTREESDDLISELPVTIHKTIIEEGMGMTRAGTTKYWHVLNYVLIKK